MDKVKSAASKQKVANTKKFSELEEKIIDELSEILGDTLTETSDFQEFESALLQAGNELVRRALKKN